MRSFLLLLLLLVLLSLTTGREGSKVSEVKGCQRGWVEFTCEYPKINGKYQDIDVVNPKRTTIRSSEKDVWEEMGRVHLYHDTKNKNLRVAIRQLEKEDFGEYKCEFDGTPESSTKELELEVVKYDCRGPFIQTSYRTAKTTITCDYPRNKNKSKFFCKENGFICEDILSTNSSLRSNGTFTLTETSRGFSVSISNLSSHHAGVYWCGEESNWKEGSYRAALRKIQLEIKATTNFSRSPTVGQTPTYWCKYLKHLKNKFICKGEDPSICEPLISDTQPNNGRFSMNDDEVKGNITITVKKVTTDDTGTYWCGAESLDNKHRNTFVTRFLMTVVSPTVSPTSSTSPVSSTQSNAASAESGGGSRVVIIVIVCVAVLLLLFVLILILIYKRSLHSENTRNGTTEQHVKEDYVYEEIQERVQKPDSGNAMNTIYATANFPTNPSALLHYSSIKFQSSSETMILKPSSSACEYSTVKHNQSPTYWTVDQPSRSSEVPLYSTVGNPQQQ